MSGKYHRRVDKNGEEYFEEEVNGAEVAKGCSSAMSGCGCLMTLFITIPFLLLLFF